MNDKQFDLITMGRVSMDLFAQDVGVPFEEVTGFDTSVGGSPVNIAIGASRLGLRSATLTAVGEDKVGDFVLRYLAKEGVTTDYIPRKPDARTGLAIVAIQPPDTFPLVFYRDNPADIYLTIDDVAALPLAQTRAVQLSGTALSRGTCRDALLFAAERCSRHQVPAVMDLDLRPDQWSHPHAFGLSIRPVLQHLAVVIGTEEEFFALLAGDPPPALWGKHLAPAHLSDLENLIQAQLAAPSGPGTLVVKRGARGVTIFSRSGEQIDETEHSRLRLGCDDQLVLKDVLERMIDLTGVCNIPFKPAIQCSWVPCQLLSRAITPPPPERLVQGHFCFCLIIHHVFP